MLRRMGWVAAGFSAVALAIGFWNDATLSLAEAFVLLFGTLGLWGLARLLWPRILRPRPARVTGLGGLNWIFVGAALASTIVVLKNATLRPSTTAAASGSRSGASESPKLKPEPPRAPWTFQVPTEEIQRDFDSGTEFTLTKIGIGNVGHGGSRLEVKAELVFMASTPNWAYSGFDYIIVLVCDGAKLNDWRISDGWGPKSATFRRNIEYLGNYEARGRPPECQLKFEHIEGHWTYRSGQYSNPRDEMRLIYSLSLRGEDSA